MDLYTIFPLNGNRPALAARTRAIDRPPAPSAPRACACVRADLSGKSSDARGKIKLLVDFPFPRRFYLLARFYQTTAPLLLCH